MNSATLVTTALGYLMPLVLLTYVRRKNDPFMYLALTAFAVFMDTAGMGKLLPFFGHSVVGGSLYFPTALLALSFAGYHLKDPRMLRRISNALLIASFFVVLGAARWLSFAVFGGTQTTHEMTTNYNLLLTASVMMFKVYFGTMIGIAFAKWKPERECYVVLPTLLEVIVTTPMAVYACFRLNPDLPSADWVSIAAWTFLVQLSLPIFIGATVCLFPKEVEHVETSSRSLSANRREHFSDCT